jgi:hypothetical protein
MRAGAVGINLTQANHVFMMDPCLNVALEDQVLTYFHIYCVCLGVNMRIFLYLYVYAYVNKYNCTIYMGAIIYINAIIYMQSYT